MYAVLSIVQLIKSKVDHIRSTAFRMANCDHYAAQSIKMQATKLDQEWRAFFTAIEDRSIVINLSTSFHEKAEQVSARCLVVF